MKLFLNRLVSYVVYRWHQRVKLQPEYGSELIELLAWLAPVHARGQKKTRVGSNRDGGYVMLDDFAPVEAALSLGIGTDVSWDLSIADREIPVWQFDHTVTAPPLTHALFHFEPKRIVRNCAESGEIALTELLHQQADKQFLLKMDIEGDEWTIMSELSPGLLRNCRQIIVEFHDFLSIENKEWCAHAKAALQSISQDFAVVHVHGNNLARHIVFAGLDLPDSLEVTFASKHYYQFEPTSETFPGPLDRKNNPYFPDFQLGQFRF